jgi:hypothetical protein
MLSIVHRQRFASVILYKFPGLSGLNLNILHAIDMHMIDNAKHTIFKWIQKEHRIVANVLLYKLRYIISKSANAFKCLGDSLTICSSSILASLVSLGILVFSKATMIF